MLVRSKLSTFHDVCKVVFQTLDIGLHKPRDFTEGKALPQSQIGFIPSSRLGLGAAALQEAPAGWVEMCEDRGNLQPFLRLCPDEASQAASHG